MNDIERNTYGTEIKATFIGGREDDGWKHFLWNVTLTREGETWDLPYKMGLAHVQTQCGKRINTSSRFRTLPCTHMRCESKGPVPTPPDLYTVLCGLKGDCTRGETFEDWAGNFGYDTDSIKAQEQYFACQREESQARRFFGSDWALILDDEDYE